MVRSPSFHAIIRTLHLARADGCIHSDRQAQYSVTKQYDDLIGHYQAGSLGALGGVSGNFDLTSYVVQKSLDGLFYEVGQEEQKIRKSRSSGYSPTAAGSSAVCPDPNLRASALVSDGLTRIAREREVSAGGQASRFSPRRASKRQRGCSG